VFDIAVVIPTFQRASFLHETLNSLLGQTLAIERFEVIVADDGSSDGTIDIVHSFSRMLNLQYLYHHDLGHRTAATRNTGARVATAPLILFLDAGTIASTRCLAAHVHAHRSRESRGTPTVVVGRVAGYNSTAFSNVPQKTESLVQPRLSSFIDDSSDKRDDELDRFGRILDNTYLPWRLAWTANLSVDASSFHLVKGFDERFTGWGAEDMEFAYRLHRRKAHFHWSDEAYALECPHPRDIQADIASNFRNLKLFHEIHPDPELEIFISARKTNEDVHDSIAEYYAWSAGKTPSDTAANPSELSDKASLLGEDAVFGRSPIGNARVVINPFCLPAGNYPDSIGYRALGLNTRLPNKCFSRVTIETRHYGPLWERWKHEIIKEADRVAKTVEISEVSLPDA
jgi:validoxylamine A glucosyltransferase